MAELPPTSGVAGEGAVDEAAVNGSIPLPARLSQKQTLSSDSISERMQKDLTATLSAQRDELRQLVVDWEARFDRLRRDQVAEQERLVDRLSEVWKDLDRTEVSETIDVMQPMLNEPLRSTATAPSPSPQTSIIKAWEEDKSDDSDDEKDSQKGYNLNLAPVVYRGSATSTRSLQSKASSFLKRSRTTVSSATVESEGSKTPLVQLLQSGQFRAFCSGMILANAIFMGAHTQTSLVSLVETGRDVGPAWEYIEQFFCVFFLCELLLRLAGMRAKFFCGEEAPWNYFDSFLVVSSSVDFITGLQGESEAVNLTFARTLRILRFARILRIIRVMRFFHSFRLMVYSILYSMVSLLWVCLLLLFIMYSFASLFLHGVTEHFRKLPTFPIDPADTLSMDLKEMYGSVPTALTSLFMGISGGRDWIELMHPLSEINSLYGYMFIFYVFFMIFGVLNVVIGIFVDSSSEISRNDRQIVTQNEMEKNKSYAHHLRRFFHEADTDKTGSLSWEEFDAYLKDTRVQAYFQSFELDVSQARTLFDLLDSDGSNNVEIDEFVQGCLRLKGTARSIDVNMLLYKSEKLLLRQSSFMKYVQEQFDVLDKHIGKAN